MKVGDVVYLNSGSRPMTIVLLENDLAQCEWGSEDGTLWSHVWPLACLSLTKPVEVVDGGDYQ